MWLAAWGAQAFACGGFFCSGGNGLGTNSSDQVAIQQSSENIAFLLDDDGTVEMCVQVYYEGAADDFAWVVPVPGVPEISTLGDSFFDELNIATAPVFRTTMSNNGQCSGVPYSYYDYGGSGYYYYYSSSGGTGPSTQEENETPAVTVLASGQVGPYETVVLESESSAALVAWLQEHAFDVPTSLDQALAPYVAAGQKLAALRLAMGEDTDHIRPVCLEWEGTTASIPIQLTSVAAAPGMGVTVWVLGADRAVPLSYYHVVPNDLAIDWWSGNLNYYDVVSRAADEAGGHGFATDVSGPTANLTDWGEAIEQAELALSLLALAPDALAWAQIAVDRFPMNSDLLGVLRTWVPMPAAVAVTEDAFYACVGCYAASTDFPAFDAAAATADLDASAVAATRKLAAWRDATAHYTRLTTSLDAAEMTVDPTFGLNAHMEQSVGVTRSLDDRAQCGNGQPLDEADRLITWPSGFTATMPSPETLDALAITEFAYLQTLGALASARIESTAEICEPLIVADNGEALLALGDAFDVAGEVSTAADLAAYNADVEACRANGGPLAPSGHTAETAEQGGCGCASTGPAPGSMASALLAGWVATWWAGATRRQRRSARPRRPARPRRVPALRSPGR